LLAAAVVAVLGFADVRSQEPQSESAPESEGLVLETAETLEFDTNQVTWASLDVSPDGKTIVFDLLGDLYTLPIEAHGDAHHRRAVIREPARVFARRQNDCVPQLPKQFWWGTEPKTQQTKAPTSSQ
jgi:hypothetical protein